MGFNLAKTGKLLRYEWQLALVTLCCRTLPFLLLLIGEKIPEKVCISDDSVLLNLTLEEDCSSPHGRAGTSLELGLGREPFSLPPPPFNRFEII